MLAVVGGHSFQDYTAYRDAALAALPGLGLELGRDVVLVGTVADDEMRAWYHAADVLAFPSSRRDWAWPCWRRWPPACRWWPATSPCSGST